MSTFVLPPLFAPKPTKWSLAWWIESPMAIIKAVLRAPFSSDGRFGAWLMVSWLFASKDTRARLSGYLYMMGVYMEAQKTSNVAVLQRFARYELLVEDFREAAEIDQPTPALREAFLDAIRVEITAMCALVARVHPEYADGEIAVPSPS